MSDIPTHERYPNPILAVRSLKASMPFMGSLKRLSPAGVKRSGADQTDEFMDARRRGLTALAGLRVAAVIMLPCATG